MTPEQIDAVLNDLERQREGLHLADTLEALHKQSEDLLRLDSSLEVRLHAGKTIPVAIAGVNGKRATDQRIHNTVTTVREQLCKELLSLPARIYDAPTRARAQNLELSIKSIDFGLLVDRYALNTLRLGQLLQEAGWVEGPKEPGQVFGPMEWHGSLPEIEKRIARLDAEHADLQARLDAALMTDDQRAQQLAAIREKNAAPFVKTRADGSRYKKFRDGRTEEIEDATT